MWLEVFGGKCNVSAKTTVLRSAYCTCKYEMTHIEVSEQITNAAGGLYWNSLPFQQLSSDSCCGQLPESVTSWIPGPECHKHPGCTVSSYKDPRGARAMLCIRSEQQAACLLHATRAALGGAMELAAAGETGAD